MKIVRVPTVNMSRGARTIAPVILVTNAPAQHVVIHGYCIMSNLTEWGWVAILWNLTGLGLWLTSKAGFTLIHALGFNIGFK